MHIKCGPVTVSLLDTGDRIVEAEGPDFEHLSLQVWSELVKPDTTVIDVGSYSGLYAIAAAKMGAHAIAIEPSPVMQERILNNAAINGVTVYLWCAAASDSIGDATLWFLDGHTSMASLDPRDPVTDPKTSPHRMVSTITLDSLRPRTPVSAIKIDVERHEAAVIRGATKILARDKPSLLIEVLPHPPGQMEALIKEIDRLEGVAYHMTDFIKSENNIVFKPW